MLEVLDVIWIHDRCIRPPGPKMVVCVEPTLGCFFRINSNPYHQTSVQILKSENTFLDHDSYLECGTPFDLDDYVVQESLRKTEGIIGKLGKSVIPQIIAAVQSERLLSPDDRNAVIDALKSV